MKKEIAKKVVGLIVGYCSSSAAQKALQANVPVETPAQKAVLRIGSFGIGMVVSAATQKQTDELIDELAEVIENFNETRGMN